MAEQNIDITFDEDNRIRVMPKEKFKQTESLEAECHGFADKIQAFSGTVDMLVEVLDGEAQKIEEEKLRAIGQRNRAEMEAEARRRKQLSMQAAIQEKTAELERLVFQLNSLERVEREQFALIEKLSTLGGTMLAVWGRVFDVSSGKEFYGEGQGYRLFAGHDCTRAFALTRRQVDMLDQGLEDLSDKQLRHLNRTYWETYVAKYPVVGRLLDPPYDPKDYDNFAGPYSAIRRTRPSLGEERPRESRCPVTRAAKAVGSAIANLIPRQLLPR
ncbi:MP3 [Symbiodinium necroappetens]|uniref:MP3 protein n=1 Tax=Symbiodinium necroappetens TaxID=1628268 RepID=A0A813C9E0_9DINO|nr:MP3 [Symbiodinium necroappetens]